MQNRLEISSLANASPKSRQAERDEIARLTKEWEKKNGKVKTTPVVIERDKPQFNNSPAKPKAKPKAAVKTKPTLADRIVEFLDNPKNRGMTRAEVIEKMQISKASLSFASKRTKYKFKPVETVKEQILKAAKEGKTIAQIAKKVGASDGYTRITLQQAGIYEEHSRINNKKVK